MHHDDYFFRSTSLDEYVSMLEENPMASLAFSGSVLDYQDGDMIYRNATEEDIATIRKCKYELVAKNCIGAPSAVIIRNNTILMDENLSWLVDVDWYLKILEINDVFIYTEAPLIANGIDGKRMTDYCLNDKELVQREYLYVYMKHTKMQDFSYVDALMSKCRNYYWGNKGYWKIEDCVAIVKDAQNDAREIWLLGDSKIRVFVIYLSLFNY